MLSAQVGGSKSSTVGSYIGNGKGDGEWKNAVL